MEKDFMQVSKLLFPEKSSLNRTPSQKFEDQLRNKLHSMRNERMHILNPKSQKQDFENENYKEIAYFIKNHVLSVGKEQAVKDFVDAEESVKTGRLEDKLSVELLIIKYSSKVK